LLTIFVSLGPTSSSSDGMPPNVNAGSSSGPMLGSGSFREVNEALELARRNDPVPAVEAPERENAVEEAARRESEEDVDTMLGDGRVTVDGTSTVFPQFGTRPDGVWVFRAFFGVGLKRIGFSSSQ